MRRLFIALLACSAAVSCGVPARAHASEASPPGDFLRLDPGTLAPAVPVPEFVGTVTNSAADQSYFAAFHQVNYSDMGRLTGYYERADWSPGPPDAAVSFRYQANYFTSTAAAAAAWEDGTVSHPVDAASSTLCQRLFSLPCSTWEFDVKGDTIRYYTLQAGVCTVELASETTARTDDVLGAAIASILTAGVNGGVQIMFDRCIDTQIGIGSITLSRTQAANGPVATSLKANRAGYVVVHWTLHSNDAPEGAGARFTLTVSRAGATVLSSTFTRRLPSYTPNAYVASFRVRLPVPGDYSVQARIAYHGQTAGLSDSLHVSS